MSGVHAIRLGVDVRYMEPVIDDNKLTAVHEPATLASHKCQIIFFFVRSLNFLSGAAQIRRRWDVLVRTHGPAPYTHYQHIFRSIYSKNANT